VRRGERDWLGCLGCARMGRRNKGKGVKEGASSMDAMDVATHGNGAEAMAVEGEAVVASPEPLIAAIRIEGDEGTATPSDHTSSDYYFDSYAHFGEWVRVVVGFWSSLSWFLVCVYVFEG
jgi:hypothetical protein